MEIARKVFDKALEDFRDSEPLADGFNISKDNEKGSKGSKFLEAFDLPAENSMFGYNGISESGIYQVNVHGALNSQYDVEVLAQKLVDYFSIKKRIGNYRLYPPSSRSGGFKNTPYYTVAVTIHYKRERKL